MFGLRAEYGCDVLRSTQAFVVFHLQISLVSVVFYGKSAYVIPRLEVRPEFRNALLNERNHFRYPMVDSLNVAITVYDDRLGVCDIPDFLIADSVYFPQNPVFIFMIRLVYLDENVELGQIQVCERILVLCSLMYCCTTNFTRSSSN